jgi:DNA-3-methyladenine glycosylase I
LNLLKQGLSWLTILRRRENYRTAYENFDPEIVAAFDDKKIEELMLDSGIIRNRRKIESSVNNAKAFLRIEKEFQSFDNYIWGFRRRQACDKQMEEYI